MVDKRITAAEFEFRKLFKNGNKWKVRKNLTSFQTKILEELRKLQEILFAHSDKNLGPVAVTLKRYIQDALVHLANRSTYEFISEEEAQKRNQALHSEIFRWTVKFRKEVGDDTVAFLRAKLKESKKEPFGFFYLLYKLHKTPLKTRPVCSDCANTSHALGIWVNQILQPLAKSQQAYFKDSFSLKDLLELIILPQGKKMQPFYF